MDIATIYKPLGQYSIDELRSVILSQPDEAWSEQTLRQNTYEVHKDTTSIVMLFCDESWPDGKVHKDKGWSRLADAATPVIDAILQQHYQPGGMVIRAMAAKLKPQGQIHPHTDSLHSFHLGHRIHVPITTNPAVRFTIDGKPFPFAVGQAYEINNQKRDYIKIIPGMAFGTGSHETTQLVITNMIKYINCEYTAWMQNVLNVKELQFWMMMLLE